PAHRGGHIPKYLLRTAFDNCLDIRFIFRALTRFKLIDGLHDDVGVSHQIVVDVPFEFVLRRIGGEICDLTLPTKPRVKSNPCSRGPHQNQRQDQPRHMALRP
ncbi:MAG: hypothetical protein ABI407_14955, partial [Bradyrhizobium sp.]